MSDVPVLTGLWQRVAMAAIGSPDVSEDEVRDAFTNPRLNLAKDTFIAIDGTGRAVAYAEVFDEHDDRAHVDVVVEPEFDDERFAAVASRGTQVALARLGDIVRERSGVATTASAGLYRGETRIGAVYRANGFCPSTTYWRMSIDVEGKRFEVPGLPDGVRIESVDPDDDDVMRTALSILNEAFIGHHGHVDMTFDEFTPVWRDTKKYDRTTWWFAYIGSDPVGINLCDNLKLDENAGYVRNLGVLPSARGRGIAKALLLTSFDEYARRGRSTVQLGVDTANDTGATRLYEGVGMHPVVVFDTFEQTVYAS
jgi:mycothiol synthase